MVRHAAIVAILIGCHGGDAAKPDAGAAHSDAASIDAGGMPHLTMTLSRTPGSAAFTVSLRAIDASGQPVGGRGFVVLTTPDGTIFIPEAPAATYTQPITPSIASGEYPLAAHLDGFADAIATPLVVPTIDDTWNQPERVAGLVNTLGWEDSAGISPDGEWLVIEYTPIDLVCCALGGAGCGGVAAGDPNGARCEDALGSYAAPTRPDFPGAERITSPTHIVDACSTVGLTTQQTFAIPPVGSYMFHRQADGSFAEPALVGFDGDDGCLSPFGITFTAAPTGNAAQVVFAFDDPRDFGPNDTGNDIYAANVTLGGPISLGTFAFDAVMSKPVATGFVPQLLGLPSVTGNQGNPWFGGQRLIYDDESQTEKDLYVADASGAFPAGPFTATKKLGLSQASRDERQPFGDGTRLYFTVNTASIHSSVLTGGADPSLAPSWSTERIDLATNAGATTGQVAAMGEPTVAHAADGTWLYFVYVLKTSTGLDANVGRVLAR